MKYRFFGFANAMKSKRAWKNGRFSAFIRSLGIKIYFTKDAVFFILNCSKIYILNSFGSKIILNWIV